MYFVETTAIGQFDNQLVGPFDKSKDAMAWAVAHEAIVAKDWRGRIIIKDVCPPEVATHWPTMD